MRKLRQWFVCIVVTLTVSAIMALGAVLFALLLPWWLILGFWAGVKSEWRNATSWRLVRIENGWDYSVNVRTGQRRAVHAVRKNAAGELDRCWLREGDILIDEDGRRVVIAKTEFGPSNVPLDRDIHGTAG